MAEPPSSAVADEIGAHGQDDVDRHLLLACRFEEQLDERRSFISRAADRSALLESEQLLELTFNAAQSGCKRQSKSAAPGARKVQRGVVVRE